MGRKIPKINSSVDELMKDIRETSDPIKKIILQKFLDIKIHEMRQEQEDPSLDDISNCYDNDSDGDNKDSDTDDSNNNHKKDNNNSNNKEKNTISLKSSKSSKELEMILKKQNSSLSELEKLNKIKAYAELVQETQKEKDQEIITNIRGKNEKVWNSDTLYDPKYAKYVKEDVVNNKLMERLNSEIDFRHDEGDKQLMEKPYDDNYGGSDMFAKFDTNDNENGKNNKNKKYIPKKTKLGNRKSYY